MFKRLFQLIAWISIRLFQIIIVICILVYVCSIILPIIVYIVFGANFDNQIDGIVSYMYLLNNYSDKIFPSLDMDKMYNWDKEEITSDVKVDNEIEDTKQQKNIHKLGKFDLLDI